MAKQNRQSERPVSRLLQPALAGLLARPWLDPVGLALLCRWYLPLSRLWAAADAAGGDCARFAGEVGQGWAPRLPERRYPAASPSVERGLREIGAADRRFDPFAFMDGARAAYRMVLEAFWQGDKDELRQLCDPAVYESFALAIDASRLLRRPWSIIQLARQVSRRAACKLASMSMKSRSSVVSLVRGTP